MPWKIYSYYPSNEPARCEKNPHILEMDQQGTKKNLYIMLSIDQRDTKKFSYHPDNGPMRYDKILNHPSNEPLRYKKNHYIILTMDK